MLNTLGDVASWGSSLLLIPLSLSGLGPVGYGEWIFALSVAAVLRPFDLGLPYSVERSVAASTAGAAAAVRGASPVVLLTSLVGALTVAMAGPALGSSSIAFPIAAVAFAFDQLAAFAMAILRGYRRFDLTSLLTFAGVVTRTIAIVLVLRARADLAIFGFTHALVSALTAIACLVLVTRLDSSLVWRPGSFRAGDFGTHLRFGASTMGAAIATAVIWDMPRIVVQQVHGPAALADYHVGQRLPFAISVLSWRMAAAVFPAASEHLRAADPRLAAAGLEASTRATLVVAVPGAVLAYVLAPQILEAWVGRAGDMTLVMRLTAAAAFFEAAGVSALHVLWGRGLSRPPLIVLSAVGLPSIVLALYLARTGAPARVAWALPLGCGTISCAMLVLAARACDASPLRVLATIRGLLVPTVACVATALTVDLAWASPRLAVIVRLCIAAAVFLVMFLIFGASAAERRMLLARRT